MCQFPLFETLAIKQGEIQNLAFHQERVNLACQTYFQISPFLNLLDIIHIPKEAREGLYRCRLDYNQHAFQLRFYPYVAKKISRFKLIYTEQLDYRFKYSNREFFEQISLAENEEAIIINNGKVSDCTIGNLLFLKQGCWYSPQDFLLKGTQLSRLLAENSVLLQEITPTDLAQFEQVMMINALNPFDPSRAVPIQAVDLAKSFAS